MTRNSTYHSVRILGGLLPSDLLERVGAQDPDLESSSPTDYDLAPGERLGGAITRSWNRLQPLWERFSERSDQTGPLTGPTRQEWLLPLFQELGFRHFSTAPGFEIEGKAYPVSHLWESTPIHLVGIGVDLDRRTPGVAGAASASPHGLMQEFLNRSDDHLWGIVSNGYQLRLLRDNASLTRTAYVEFDLREMFEGDAYSDFALLWLTCHASRLEGPAGKQVLERWREHAATRGIRALDALRNGVEAAIETLGSAAVGHPDNVVLRQQLDDGTLDAQDLYRQILRVVYRFLFLFVAEGRDLLLDPAADRAARTRYEHYYSISRLRDLAGATRGGPHCDLWRQHSIVARALEAAGEPDLGLLPLGGFLWSSEATAALNDVTVPNDALLCAIRSLTMVTPPGELPQRVDYANLGAEELGSIYEALLEYIPEVNPVAGAFELSASAGSERKTTGSYYTPTPLIVEVLDSALDPVLDLAEGSDNPEGKILDLKVVDSAAGSGHFLIAAANRIANRLARVRAGVDEPSPSQLRTALRDVIGRCIYAVDINPMAVELAKVALWIEAMEPGKPLTFLDHHIVCGNSLLGATPSLLDAGIPDEAYVAFDEDDAKRVATLRARNRRERERGLATLTFEASTNDLLQEAATAISAIDDLSSDTVQAVAEKQRRYEDLTASVNHQKLRLAADAWIAAFVGRHAEASPEITTAIVNAAIQDPSAIPDDLADSISEIADRSRSLHWHLTFPAVFDSSRGRPNTLTGLSGGFDVVLGNPPWEQEEIRESEFFAATEPQIAVMDAGQERDAAIKKLKESSPKTYQLYKDEKRRGAALTNYYRKSGRFPLSGVGRMNTAALFTENFIQICRSGGATGLIVPTSIFTDRRLNSSKLVSELLKNHDLARLIDFENRGRFPAVHNQQRFCCVTFLRRDPWFVTMRSETQDSLGEEYDLTRSELVRWNPDLTSLPLFRSVREKNLAVGMFQRFPSLRDDSGWSASASAVYHMTNDRKNGHFYDVPGTNRLPLFESKMVGMFNHRAADIYISSTARTRKAQASPLSAAELANPLREASPRFWVSARECEKRLADMGHGFSWTIAWKDVSSSTNTRTLIPCILPGSASGHTLWTLFLPTIDPRSHLAVTALLGSIATDFLVRKQVAGNHVVDSLVLNLPMPSPSELEAPCPWDPSESLQDWLASRALELSATSLSLSPLATDTLGRPCTFTWTEERRQLLEAEISAASALIYGLSEEDSAYIRATFATTESKDLRRLLDLSGQVETDLREAASSGSAYQTQLNPPPADPSLCHERV